jgi:hypothetical protein
MVERIRDKKNRQMENKRVILPSEIKIRAEAKKENLVTKRDIKGETKWTMKFIR